MQYVCCGGLLQQKNSLHNNQVIRVASKYPAIAEKLFL